MSSDYFSYSVKKRGRVKIQICAFNSQLSRLCSYVLLIFCSIFFFCPLEHNLVTIVSLWQFLTCFLIRSKCHATATKNTEKERYWFWERHFASYSGTTLVKRSDGKLPSSGFSLYCSDMIFFKARILAMENSLLYVNPMLHMLRYFNFSVHFIWINLNWVFFYLQKSLSFLHNISSFTFIFNENCTVCHWSCQTVDQYLIIKKCVK